MTQTIFLEAALEQKIGLPLIHPDAITHASSATFMSQRCLELLKPQEDRTEGEQAAYGLAALALQAGQRAMELAEVERVPRYRDGRRENDAEHCFSLTVIATEVAHQLDIGLNMLDVHRFCIAHEWLELEMKDIPTFLLDQTAMDDKEAQEQAISAHVLRQLPPYQQQALQDYMRQDTPEARIVRLLDKQTPVTYDILGQGVRIMKEDYDVHSAQRLAECHDQLFQRLGAQFADEFPLVVKALDILYGIFELTAAPELD